VTQELARPGHTSAFAAVDVHYLGAAGARAALLTATDPRFAVVTDSRTKLVPDPGPYRSGEFYLRELPPLRAVLQDAGPLDLIVVDGYVDLDPAGRPGLGALVHGEFGAPVIGVAKSLFLTATHAALVLRGASARPLYVTAAGLPVADAAALVSEMAGPFRIPDALRRADRLARGTDLPLSEPTTTRCRNIGACQPYGIL
jgi:deoxyribonuclease V